MNGNRIQTGSTERILAVALDLNLTALTGLTDLKVMIQRTSDGFWFDFGDLTFKSVGWGTRQQAMTEVSASLAPGQYYYDFNTSTIVNASANDAYLITVTQTPGTTVKNIPQVGELKVGQYVDYLDAVVTSRATQAQILSDATPFPGARIDAAISSRAAPGAAMDLITDAVDSDAVATSAVTEIQTGLATATALAAVQADTDDLQLRIPAALVSGRMDASVGAMANDVLTAAAIANGAIGSSEAPLLANLDATVSSRAAPGAAMDLVTDAVDADALATSAITELDAALTSAHGSGAWTGSTASAVATAVWGEALPGAHGVGSAGKIVGDDLDAKVSSRSTLTQADILSDATPFPGARIDAAISSRAAPGAAMDLVTDAVDANALATSAVSEIGSALSTAHGSGSWEGGTPAAIADAVWDEAIAGHVGSGSAGAELQGKAEPGDAMALTPGERATVSDAVWDELIAGHSGVGSAGKELQDKPTAPEIDTELSVSHGASGWGGASAASVATAVWDEDVTGHTIPSSFGLEVLDKPSAAAIDAELSATHGSGAWGGSASAVAAAVWDEALPGAHPPGSAGAILPARAIPGDAMALTSGERSAVALRTWQEPVPGTYAAGQAGKVLGDNLDTPVGTRALPGSAMALTSGERATLSAKVWDEAVPGSHLPGTAAEVLSGIEADVDVPVSSRAAPGDAMALTAPSLGLVAGRVWDEVVPGGHVAGTAGEVLGSAGVQLDAPVSSRAEPGDAMTLTPAGLAAAATKVWDETLPGAHAAGSAGERLASTDNLVDVATSSRAAAGDAMVLTAGERLAVAGKVWDETLPGSHGTGSAGRLVADLEARLTLARAGFLDQIPDIADQVELARKILKNRLELTEGATSNWVLYDDDDVTPLITWSVSDKDGHGIRIASFTPARRRPV